MGKGISSMCMDCGEEFKVFRGGGFGYDRLHCDSCSATTDVLFDQKMYEKLEENYVAWVERTVDKCSCGGSFKYDAKPRCPTCESENITEHQ